MRSNTCVRDNVHGNNNNNNNNNNNKLEEGKEKKRTDNYMADGTIDNYTLYSLVKALHHG